MYMYKPGFVATDPFKRPVQKTKRKQEHIKILAYCANLAYAIFF